MVRNRTIRAYVVVVVVILNALSWLSGILCYHGYKPAGAQQAPPWGGALKAGLQHSKEEEGGLSQLFCQKLQTAALTNVEEQTASIRNSDFLICSQCSTSN